jgi:two-component system response regulator
MRRQLILLVEDNSDDEALAIHALKKSNLANEIAVAQDGVKALRFLILRGK